MDITDRELERLADAIIRRLEEKQQVEEVAAAIVRMLTEEQKQRLLQAQPAHEPDPADTHCPDDPPLEPSGR